MKGFLCLLLAVLGLLALRREEHAPLPATTTERALTEETPQTPQVIPPLAERHAARDAHLRKRLVEAHGPHCKCGRH